MTGRIPTVGDRVQLHPAADAWMSGDRYGTVTAIDADDSFDDELSYYRVKLDSGRRQWFTLDDILEVVK